MKLVWVSRHQLSNDQLEALDPACEVVPYGDMDVFNEWAVEEFMVYLCGFNKQDVLVGTVHPMLAMALIKEGYSVIISENEMRAKEGAKPTFHFNQWHVVNP